MVRLFRSIGLMAIVSAMLLPLLLSKPSYAAVAYLPSVFADVPLSPPDRTRDDGGSTNVPVPPVVEPPGFAPGIYSYSDGQLSLGFTVSDDGTKAQDGYFYRQDTRTSWPYCGPLAGYFPDNYAVTNGGFLMVDMDQIGHLNASTPQFSCHVGADGSISCRFFDGYAPQSCPAGGTVTFNPNSTSPTGGGTRGRDG